MDRHCLYDKKNMQRQIIWRIEKIEPYFKRDPKIYEQKSWFDPESD